MSISTMPAPSTETPSEWGRSTEPLPHEAANLAPIATVAPLWSTRDIPALLEHYAGDIDWRNVAMGEVYDGKEAVRAFLERLFAAAGHRLEVTLRVPRGKYVTEEYVLCGTHLGPMFGLPADRTTRRDQGDEPARTVGLPDDRGPLLRRRRHGDAADGLLPGGVRGREACRAA